jgi:DNA-directed RNA polymerase subunit RPC12/RpoP
MKGGHYMEYECTHCGFHSDSLDDFEQITDKDSDYLLCPLCYYAQMEIKDSTDEYNNAVVELEKLFNGISININAFNKRRNIFR